MSTYTYKPTIYKAKKKMRGMRIMLGACAILFAVTSYTLLHAAAAPEQQDLNARDNYASELAEAYAQGDGKQVLNLLDFDNLDVLSTSALGLAEAKILFDSSGWWHQKPTDPDVQANRKKIARILELTIKEAFLRQNAEKIKNASIRNPLDMGPTNKREEAIKAFATYYKQGNVEQALSSLHNIPLIAQVKVITNPGKQSWWKESMVGSSELSLHSKRAEIEKAVNHNIIESFFKDHSAELNAFIIKKPFSLQRKELQSNLAHLYFLGRSAGKWIAMAKKANDPISLVKIMTALDEWWQTGPQTDDAHNQRDSMRRFTLNEVIAYYAQKHQKEIEHEFIPKKGEKDFYFDVEDLTDEELSALHLAKLMWQGNTEKAFQKIKDVSIPALVKIATDRKSWWQSTYPNNEKDMTVFENRQTIIEAIQKELLKHFIDTHQAQLDALIIKQPIDEKEQMEAAELQRREQELREQSVKVQERHAQEHSAQEAKAEELRKKKLLDEEIEKEKQNLQVALEALENLGIDTAARKKLFNKYAIKYHPDKQQDTENDPKRKERFTEYFKALSGRREKLDQMARAMSGEKPKQQTYEN